MSNAYRTNPFLCPICPSSALREFQGRLACDECAGMFLDAEDFARSIREIDGSTDALAITDAGAAGKGCPRCGNELSHCTLALGGRTLDGAFLRCAHQGIWVPRDAMTAAFAHANRHGGGRGLGVTHSARGYSGSGGGGADGASIIANMPSAHAGMSGAMSSIANAFGGGAPATSGLAISNWQPHRPRVHTVFVSAYKDQRLACPACANAALAYGGDRWTCTTCAGAFVENEPLVAMISEMALGPWELPSPTGAPGELTCPICATPMHAETIEGVATARCAAHGVWFAAQDLEHALHHASAPAHGLKAWLRRLFGPNR